MNSASQNFPRHLGALRERMLHPTDYESAVTYFLEEFAGDEAFVNASDPEQMPHLLAILKRVISKGVGKEIELEVPRISYLRAHKFVHGNAQASGNIILFFYFEEADTGIVMIMAGLSGQMQVARFKMAGGLINPSKN